MNATTVAADLGKSAFQIAVADDKWRTAPEAPLPDSLRSTRIAYTGLSAKDREPRR